MVFFLFCGGERNTNTEKLYFQNYLCDILLLSWDLTFLHIPLYPFKYFFSEESKLLRHLLINMLLKLYRIITSSYSLDELKIKKKGPENSEK